MRRLALVVCLALLALPSCGGEQQLRRGGTLLVLHGLGDTEASLRLEPVVELLDHVEARGWKVITPRLPATGLTDPAVLREMRGLLADPAGYRQAWVARATKLLAGAPRPVVITGFSWGGLHALLAACEIPGVAGYLVNVPVVDASDVAQFAGLDTAALSPRDCGDELTMPGWIGYGEPDPRVGPSGAELAHRLADLGRPVTVEAHVGAGHATTEPIIGQMVDWLDDRFPPGELGRAQHGH